MAQGPSNFLQNFIVLLSLMKLLIVEDEKDLMSNMESYFQREDMDFDLAYNYREAVDHIYTNPYDLVVLDIMLPDGNGLNILKVLKKEQPEVGVLIVSARNLIDDKVQGLELGADDYLTKPFHLAELNARLKAIYRRRKKGNGKVVFFGEIKINTESHEVFVQEKALELTLKEYELLVYLITNQNRVLTKQAIAEHLWGENADFLDSFDFVYQHIKNLRKKITALGAKDYIKTIYGLGYKFC